MMNWLFGGIEVMEEMANQVKELRARIEKLEQSVTVIRDNKVNYSVFNSINSSNQQIQDDFGGRIQSLEMDKQLRQLEEKKRDMK